MSEPRFVFKCETCGKELSGKTTVDFDPQRQTYLVRGRIMFEGDAYESSWTGDVLAVSGLEPNARGERVINVGTSNLPRKAHACNGEQR